VGVRISDIFGGFKAIRLKTLSQLDLKSEGTEVDAEIIVKALTKGFRIVEVPVTYRARFHYQQGLNFPVLFSKLRKEFANFKMLLFGALQNG
jgi:hypothetical protein